MKYSLFLLQNKLVDERTVLIIDISDRAWITAFVLHYEDVAFPATQSVRERIDRRVALQISSRVFVIQEDVD